MTVDTLFFWVVLLAFCELALAATTASLLGSGGVLIVALCAWLTRYDLDLLAFLLAATYSSVLVCLSLVQLNLEGYPGLATGAPTKTFFFGADAVLLFTFGGFAVSGCTDASVSPVFTNFYQADGDWFEQAIGVFHVFFYRTATFEAILLNLFLLLALIASLGLMGLVGTASGGLDHAAMRQTSRIRVVRAFRRQVRRKNASQIRSAKR